MHKKDVLFIEQIPDEKRDFDAEIILWRRQRRMQVITQWVLIICFVLVFVLTVYNNKQVSVAEQQQHIIFLARIEMRGKQNKQVAYPAPKPQKLQPLFESFVYTDTFYAKDGELYE